MLYNTTDIITSGMLYNATKGRLRVFTFWFDRESIIPGNFWFAISVCRLRERGRMSKNVYVRVFHDLELLRDVFFFVRSNDSFNFPLG